MTSFEIIILAVIYLVCYGYILTMFFAMFLKKEENAGLMLLLAMVSLVFATYAPIMFGSMLYEKLKEK